MHTSTAVPCPGKYLKSMPYGVVPYHLRRGSGQEVHSILRSRIVPGPLLLGSTGASIATSAAEQLPASLALVDPSNLRWRPSQDRRDRPQVRALFELRGQMYDLPLTDPSWSSVMVRQLSRLGPGSHAHEELNVSGKILLTMSLSEPFNGYCYKLVAAMVVVTGWR